MPWGFVHFIDPREHFAHDQVSQGKLVLSKRSEKEWFWKTLWWPIYIYIYICFDCHGVWLRGLLKALELPCMWKNYIKGATKCIKMWSLWLQIVYNFEMKAKQHQLQHSTNELNVHHMYWNVCFTLCILTVHFIRYAFSAVCSHMVATQCIYYCRHGQDNLLFLEFTVHWLSPLGCGGMGDLTANVVPACA